MAGIVLKVESFMDNLPELKPIFPIHWAELALDKDEIELDMRYDVYEKSEAAGSLYFVTMRKDRELIGYYVGFIDWGLHYKTTLTCQTDIFYLRKEFRGSKRGTELFQFIEKDLIKKGVKRWYVGSKCHLDVSYLFEQLNFERVEIAYSKLLGD